MPLLGQSALAMWWDIAPDVRQDFEHWHSHEHFPERLGIPGFMRASRWSSASGGEGFFVLYELKDHGVLASPDYLERLNAPTPWSQRLMPHHRNMVRTQCRVLESAGGVIARQVLTLRLAPAAGRADDLRAALRERVAAWSHLPGLAGTHLVRHEPPPIAQTAEQKIRPAVDQGADWVLIVSGYDAAALEKLAQEELSEDKLKACGALPGTVRGRHALSYSAVSREL